MESFFTPSIQAYYHVFELHMEEYHLGALCII